jgi:hypothetical protein
MEVEEAEKKNKKNATSSPYFCGLGHNLLLLNVYVLLFVSELTC